jgi:hypothetical protein
MATRFYLPAFGDSVITPDYDANWDDTSRAVRYPAVTATTDSVMTSHLIPDDNDDTNMDLLLCQFISDAIESQTIPSQTVKLQIRGMEDSSVNNMVVSISIRVVSNDGSSVTGTLLSLTRDDTELVAGIETNRSFSATTTELAVNANDRIVIEIGVGGDPGNNQDHASQLSIGDDSATDLPENDSETTAYNPWIEFATTIAGLELGGGEVSTYTVFNTIIGSPISWTWNSGQFYVDSGIRAIKGSTSTWGWGLISSSSIYYHPSGNPNSWIMVSGSFMGGGT